MRVQLFGRIDGWSGTVRTIQQMLRLVDEGKKDTTIQFTARQIARKYDPKDYVGQARGIFQFVKKYIHYVRDPHDLELLHTPIHTLRARAGDCDDQAILFCALAQAIGFNTKFKTIKADRRFPDEYSHVYSLIDVPGKGWMPSDTIVKEADLGWETPGQYESKTWGGLGMLGAETAAATTTTSSGGFWNNLVSGFKANANDLGNLLGKAVVGATGDYLNVPVAGQTKTPGLPAAKSGLPGWLVPAALGGAAILGVGFVMMKKRRRRR